MASQPSVDYVEVAYTDIDNGGDGIGLIFNRSVSDNWVLNGDLFYSSESGGGMSIDITALALGVDYKMDIAERTILQVGPQLLYVNVDVSGNFGGQTFSGSDSETGFGARALVRHMLTDQFELNGGGYFYNIASETNFDTVVGARFHFNERFSASASVFIGDGDAVQLGLAYHF